MNDKFPKVCDQKIYESLFYDHYEKLRNYLFYKYGDLARAEDVVQESYAKLWQNCEKIIFDSAKSFLYKIANNTSLNAIRDKKTRLKYVEKLKNNDTAESPEFQLEEKEFGIKLQKAIANLRDKHREAFLLHRIEKKTYLQIAELLGISIKAVEKRIHLALESLKNEIGHYKL